MPMMLAT
jgi:chromosome segregation ATPase